MQYSELGEARILKRYSKDSLLKPVRRSVSQSVKSDNWQSLDQAAERFLRDIKPSCAHSVI